MLCGNTVPDSCTCHSAEVTCGNSSICQDAADQASQNTGSRQAQGNVHEVKTREQREESYGSDTEERTAADSGMWRQVRVTRTAGLGSGD